MLGGGLADDAPGLAMQIWAISHGVATLANGGHFGPAGPGRGDPEQALAAGVRNLLEHTARPVAPTGPWGR